MSGPLLQLIKLHTHQKYWLHQVRQQQPDCSEQDHPTLAILVS